jgi:hypothetical protein
MVTRNAFAKRCGSSAISAEEVPTISITALMLINISIPSPITKKIFLSG